MLLSVVNNCQCQLSVFVKHPVIVHINPLVAVL